jgi:hypothetical protein
MLAVRELSLVPMPSREECFRDLARMDALT